ncbi:heavy-metal-associated domain-containing protein [Patescibacteria group bacterium]|nr:heavy-metal-associated domain-containing protein [Patescibacteria group bacterium]
MTTQIITYRVNDMHCPSCPKIIQMNLEETPGVSSVQASLETKKVTIEYDPTAVKPEQLSQVIKDTGYTPVVEPLA